MTGAVAAGEIAAWWPVPGAESHKHTHGVVGINAGSPQYPGVVLLAISGVLRVGPGMVYYLGSAPHDPVVGRFPSVVLADGQIQAMVVESGWGALVDIGPRLWEVPGRRVPLVIDVDALRLLPADLPAETLLTPHASELVQLLRVERGEIEADPMAAAVLAAGRFGATVSLRGAVQPVAPPDDPVRLALFGPARTAQAGSGGVLAGACGTLLAAGLPAERARLIVASPQALTASRFPGPYPPDVQASRFPEVVRELLVPDQQ